MEEKLRWEYRWRALKPKCSGCIYQGTSIPCQYILITGKSPKSQGAHIYPEGDGGCELYDNGKKDCAKGRGSKIDYDKVYELYKKKMSDGQIAVKVGCDRTSIRHWRNRNGLEANFKTPGSIGKGKRPTSEISKLDKPKFFKMHENGASDKEIADAAGVQKHTARSWRLKNSLPMNDSRGRRSTIDNNKVLKLYEAGKMDREIAEQIGVHLTAIAAWRKKRGLEANRYRNARRI